TSSEVPSRDYVIAGHHIRLRAAGPEMIRRLAPAFGHLEAESVGSPDLTINLWDSATTGAPPPPLPDVQGEQKPGAFFYYSSPRMRLGYQLGTSGDVRELELYAEAPTPALSVLEEGNGSAWYWVEDAPRIPYWEAATPMLYLFDWWFRDRDIHQLHAGAVGTPEGGVLLVGKSGSGKSTSTLSTLGSELGYAGDDFVAVSLEP